MEKVDFEATVAKLAVASKKQTVVEAGQVLQSDKPFLTLTLTDESEWAARVASHLVAFQGYKVHVTIEGSQVHFEPMQLGLDFTKGR